MLIVNRVHPTFGDESPAGLSAAAEELRAHEEESNSDERRRLASWYENLADFRQIATLERAHTNELREGIGAGAIAFVPYLAHDVYDFEALGDVGRFLLGAQDA